MRDRETQTERARRRRKTDKETGRDRDKDRGETGEKWSEAGEIQAERPTEHREGEGLRNGKAREGERQGGSEREIERDMYMYMTNAPANLYVILSSKLKGGFILTRPHWLPAALFRLCNRTIEPFPAFC